MEASMTADLVRFRNRVTGVKVTRLRGAPSLGSPWEDITEEAPDQEPTEDPTEEPTEEPTSGSW